MVGMKTLILAAAAGLALMACSPSTEPARDTAPADDRVQPMPEPAPPAPPPAPDPAQPAAEDTCGMAQYASLVGKPATDPGLPAASGAVRHIRPDTQVTMDYRPDRLNIDIDDSDVITGFRCG